MEISPEEKRLITDALSSLCYYKNDVVQLLLEPAKIPKSVYEYLLTKRDNTGQLLSKRKLAPLIVDKIECLVNGQSLARNLTLMISKWDRWEDDNPDNEARKVAARAQLFLAGELKPSDKNYVDESRNKIKLTCDLLLKEFTALQIAADHQNRGYKLESILNRLFEAYGYDVTRSFKRNDGSEQIDGAFKHEGWHYIVECRWRQKLSDTRDLDGLLGQVNRSGKQTMGLFLSIEGWSDNVLRTLPQNTDKSVFLMDGYDLYSVLSQFVGLETLLNAKLKRFNLNGEPFLSAKEII